jgi:hypothetical protein
MDPQLQFCIHDTVTRTAGLMRTRHSISRVEELGDRERVEASYLYRRIHEIWSIMDRDEITSLFSEENERMEDFILWYVALDFPAEE